MNKNQLADQIAELTIQYKIKLYSYELADIAEKLGKMVAENANDVIESLEEAHQRDIQYNASKDKFVG